MGVNYLEFTFELHNLHYEVPDDFTWVKFAKTKQAVYIISIVFCMHVVPWV